MNVTEPKVIFTSPLVDPASSVTLANETLEACLLICKLTNWSIRILSKGTMLPHIAKGIPDEYRERVIFGFSTGTLDDGIAKYLEKGTALVSKRLEALRWLQDNGFRTYGMICPSLPQIDADRFVERALDLIRADRCEYVWAEVLNVRGDSLLKSSKALEEGGFIEDAARLTAVFSEGHSEAWERYAQETFLAYTRHLSPDKLRFLQYPTSQSSSWWAEHRDQGALLLGTHGRGLN
jgi:DNA repair photolyase